MNDFKNTNKNNLLLDVSRQHNGITTIFGSEVDEWVTVTINNKIPHLNIPDKIFEWGTDNIKQNEISNLMSGEFMSFKNQLGNHFDFNELAENGNFILHQCFHRKWMNMYWRTASVRYYRICWWIE